ncbi:hypothetical protein NE237_016422 [Protea cynaroides]|uniref:Uncharacterized protein n=1 Tax=Protea cynaroides TaxID=273540 RepID=A0A9Q0HE00_9MAGN|nr:hypothetical protein NE237_016422 [Protea cynaroides]
MALYLTTLWQIDTSSLNSEHPTSPAERLGKTTAPGSKSRIPNKTSRVSLNGYAPPAAKVIAAVASTGNVWKRVVIDQLDSTGRGRRAVGLQKERGSNGNLSLYVKLVNRQVPVSQQALAQKDRSFTLLIVHESNPPLATPFTHSLESDSITLLFGGSFALHSCYYP